jgi:hypothetical protein
MPGIMTPNLPRAGAMLGLLLCLAVLVAIKILYEKCANSDKFLWQWETNYLLVSFAELQSAAMKRNNNYNLCVQVLGDGDELGAISSGYSGGWLRRFAERLAVHGNVVP